MKKRVVIVGLDGGDFDLIMQWMAELPNMRKIVERGASGYLHSTFPQMSPVAWSSLMTGKNPGKHGVFGFMRRNEGTYEFTSNLYAKFPCKTLWEILGDSGMRSVVIDTPMTYPPQKVNGVIVAGMGTPTAESDFIHPRESRGEILGVIGDEYMVDVPMIPGLEKTGGAEDRFIGEIYKLTKQRMDIADHLMGKEDWDFFMVTFIATDRMCHGFWRYIDPAHPDYTKEGAAKYSREILKLYKFIDDYVGTVAARLKEGDTLIICSDHGFEPFYFEFWVKQWLSDNGFFYVSGSKVYEMGSEAMEFEGRGAASQAGEGNGVRLQTCAPGSYSGLRIKLAGLSPAIEYVARSVACASVHGMVLELDNLRGEAKILGSRVVGTTPKEYKMFFTPDSDTAELAVRTTSYGGFPCGSLHLSSLAIEESNDWRKTLAYPAPQSPKVLYLNVKGREPYGAVKKGEEYEKTLGMLKRTMENSVYDSGQHIFNRVKTKYELFKGSMLESAPEIVYDLNPIPGVSSKYTAPSGWSGGHKPDGVFMAYGEGTRNARVDASIMDIAPTVLHLLGLPIPDDMDGKVIEGALARGAQKVRFKSSSAGESRNGDGVSAKDEEILQERLRKLGYIG